ncbi:hypothetical protein B0H17DRAFT_1207170 [Mycena rosella]|uniref:Uncharacterized protein n=1 Tax=Mycena rosella TaxID=1033263 RepID=A0AAD7D3E1_MYCRO|nr:hypothetical protein B0H17DRAFT_1207170 [Mycena rosella]
MPIVDPNDYIPHLIIWSTFNIFAACSNIVLLTVTLISQRRAANHVLVNLEVIFIFTSASASLLIWTGHARDLHPPHNLCFSNALLAMSNVPFMGGSALAIVIKVWGSVMIACHPRWRPTVEWIIWMPFLVALPYVSGLPLLDSQIGLQDRSKIFRGSPFYCVLDQPSLQNAASGFGAAYTFMCLVLSTWTTFNLITTRWRVRRIIEYPGVSYPFVCRVLLFSILVSAAFVVGILSLLSTFAAVVPDVVLSSCGVGVFFIFSTAKPIIQFVFRCRRVKSVTTRTVSPWHSGLANTVAETPQELLTFAVRSDLSGSAKTASVGFIDEQSWRAKTVATPDAESGLEDEESGYSKEPSLPR